MSKFSSYLWKTLTKNPGQATNLRQKITKRKSDVFNPQNSFCKKC